MNPNGDYLDVEELWMLGNRLLRAGRKVEAGRVLDIIFDQFPRNWVYAATVPSWDGYLENGTAEMIRKIYRHALGLTPRYPWERELKRQAMAVLGVPDSELVPEG